MKDYWKGKRTKARMKVATALQKVFKNKKARKEVKQSSTLKPSWKNLHKKLKQIRIWKPETIAKRQAAKEQRARDREIIKQENADPANKEWVKKVRAEMRGGKKSRKKKKKCFKQS